MTCQAKQTKKGRLFVLGGLLLALGILIYSLFMGLDDLCGNDHLVETISPSGQLKAVAFRRDCGATTGYSTHVSILPASRKLPNEAGNVFVQDREPMIIVRWLDDQHLSISGGRAGTAFVHLSDFHGVRIDYE
jgi:Family of unknown function (DUF5412)